MITFALLFRLMDSSSSTVISPYDACQWRLFRALDGNERKKRVLSSRISVHFHCAIKEGLIDLDGASISGDQQHIDLVSQFMENHPVMCDRIPRASSPFAQSIENHPMMCDRGFRSIEDGGSSSKKKKKNLRGKRAFTTIPQRLQKRQVTPQNVRGELTDDPLHVWSSCEIVLSNICPKRRRLI